MSIFELFFSDILLQVLLTLPNGARDPVVPKPYAMRAVCDGPRRRRKRVKVDQAAQLGVVPAAWEVPCLSWTRARREKKYHHAVRAMYSAFALFLAVVSLV